MEALRSPDELEKATGFTTRGIIAMHRDPSFTVLARARSHLTERRPSYRNVVYCRASIPVDST